MAQIMSATQFSKQTFSRKHIKLQREMGSYNAIQLWH